MEADTVVLMITIVVSVLGSTLTVVTLMFRQFNHFDNKLDRLDTRVAGLEASVSALDASVSALDASVSALDARVGGLDARVGGLDAKVTALDAKFDVMARDVSDARERLARVEGHLMAPEGFTLRTPQPPTTEDPEPGHRVAG